MLIEIYLYGSPVDAPKNLNLCKLNNYSIHNRKRYQLLPIQKIKVCMYSFDENQDIYHETHIF